MKSPVQRGVAEYLEIISAGLAHVFFVRAFGKLPLLPDMFTSCPPPNPTLLPPFFCKVWQMSHLHR